MIKVWVVGNAEGSIGEAVQKDIEARGWKVIGTNREDLNVARWDKVELFCEDQGPFNYIAYCAGVADLAWVSDLNKNTVDAVFQVNVIGFMGVMRALSITQEEGSVCAIVSDAAKVPMRGSMAYCSSKAALEQAIKVAAREMAPKWRVNGVSPSAVDGTKMTEFIDGQVPLFRGWTPTKAKAYEMASIPMKRRARKTEVADVIVQTLLGPEFLTGSIISLTGGK